MTKLYKLENEEYTEVNLEETLSYIVGELRNLYLESAKKRNNLNPSKFQYLPMEEKDIENIMFFLDKNYFDFENNRIIRHFPLQSEFLESEKQKPSKMEFMENESEARKVHNLTYAYLATRDLLQDDDEDYDLFEVSDFEDLRQKFMEKISWLRIEGNARQHFDDMMQSIDLKNITNENKIETFINFVLEEYDANVYSEQGDKRKYAKGLSDFVFANFGINLSAIPEELKGQGKLNLYSLILENNKNKKIISENNNDIAIMIGQPISILSNATGKQKLILELNDYMLRRRKKDESLYDLLFVSDKHYRDPQIRVAKQLRKAIERGEKLALDEREQVSLHEGELGEIYNKYSTNSELRKVIPENIARAEVTSFAPADLTKLYENDGEKLIEIDISEKLGNLTEDDKKILNGYFEFGTNSIKNDVGSLVDVMEDIRTRARRARNLVESDNLQTVLDKISDKLSVYESHVEDKLYDYKLIAANFKKEIEKQDPITDELQSIINSFNKINIKNVSTEMKVEKLADILIYQYGKMVASGDNTELANMISLFCKESLGINLLPESVDKKNSLTLATLILHDKNSGIGEEPKYITPKFLSLINKPLLTDLISPEMNEDSKRELFLLYLQEYKTRRENEEDSLVGSLFGRDRYNKLDVRKQLKKAVINGKNTAFDEQQMKVLNNGRLGGLIKTFPYPDILPEQVRKIRADYVPDNKPKPK